MLIAAATSSRAHYYSLKDQERAMDRRRPVHSERTTGDIRLTPFSSNADGVMQVVCPALSLLHPVNKDNADRSFTQDRKQAEGYAARLLERPIEFSSAKAGSQRQEHLKSCLDHVPLALLQNVKESFATLTDCRLRAYASFMTAHALEAATEPALMRLLETGLQMTPTNASLKFVTMPSGSRTLEDPCLDEAKAVDGKLDFLLEVTLDVQFGHQNGEGRIVSVTITAPGHIKDSSDVTSSSSSAKIYIDTQHLLLQMINQASKVVSAVVELVNNASPIIPGARISRSSSYILMPPPPAKQLSKDASEHSVSGLEMLSEAALGLGSGMPSTSDAFGAAKECDQDQQGSEHAVVSDDEDQVVSHLSPEQCASIVDGVFGECDDDFCLGPPAKRFKTLARASNTTSHGHY